MSYRVPHCRKSADRVLRRLIDAGLLTTKDGTVELAHERLIDDWPELPLKTWLVQDAAERRLIDQLRERVSDDTLPEGLLAQAEELLHRDHGLATEEPGVAALVQRSRDWKRARERRRWIVLGVISIAAIGFLGLALRALSQRSEAIAAKIVAQDAERFGGAFWEVRSVLGRNLADRLLARAWQSMAWPIAEQGTALKFIEGLLLNARF